jgi:hypothetical protein
MWDIGSRGQARAGFDMIRENVVPARRSSEPGLTCSFT